VHRYYEILGLAPGASKQDVKRAYRKLAMQYHPDINKAPGAKEIFLRITEAYNYLLNPPKYSGNSAEKQRKAEEEQVKRAKAAATRAARERYAAFKRRQEAEQSRAYSQAITSLIGIVFLIAAIYFGNRYISRWYVDANPAEVTARITKLDERHFWLAYKVDGKEYIKEFSGSRTKLWLVAPNGMPIFNNEKFVLVYRAENPKRCYIKADVVLPPTLHIYQAILRPVIAEQQAIKVDDARIDCLSLMVFDRFGVDGLANLFFWDESFLENFSNNSISYNNMIEEQAYKEILTNCLLTEE